ncbi:hypothetical protein ABT096_29525 [Streptomyces sp. NPDC002561]|uniref:hypothetical protein n=1 Tax=Streptomyces sp. NPDC002561 TaxID=3154418 RepID=UPI00331E8926
MRSDHTALFVATRPYSSRRDARRAVYEHNRRVARAERGSELALQTPLTMSGETVMAVSDYECQACCRSVGMAFEATSETHRITGRSGGPTRRPVGLCVPCWSRYVRYEGDPDDMPTATVRFA